MLVAQLLLQVLDLGAAYALVALGFVLILNATGAVNFSQGDLVMSGGFVAVLLASHWQLPGFLSLPLLLVLMAALGALLALLAYLPLKSRPPDSVFISTIATGIILQNLANILFGAEPLAAPPLFGAGRLNLAGVDVSVQSLTIIGVATGLLLAIHVLFRHTQFGRRLRATAQDRDMAMALGIPVDAMIVATFATSAALAGAAGLLLSNVFFVTPTVGTDYMLKAYMAVVIGGWGSIPGAVAGALLIAAFEVLYPSLSLLLPALQNLPAQELLFSQTASAIMLELVVLVILVVRPQGLFRGFIDSRP